MPTVDIGIRSFAFSIAGAGRRRKRTALRFPPLLTPRSIHWCVNTTLAQHISPGPAVSLANFSHASGRNC
ncbi:hypothetical protein F0402_07505 [Mycolicibacter arupensis]|nr:hypothetical protein F0402_07505 [Mycolicibacter arupensis]